MTSNPETPLDFTSFFNDIRNENIIASPVETILKYVLDDNFPLFYINSVFSFLIKHFDSDPDLITQAIIKISHKIMNISILTIILSEKRFDMNSLRSLLIPYLNVRSISRHFPQTLSLPFNIQSPIKGMINHFQKTSHCSLLLPFHRLLFFLKIMSQTVY